LVPLLPRICVMRLPSGALRSRGATRLPP
jgi:hypothetical protein